MSGTTPLQLSSEDQGELDELLVRMSAQSACYLGYPNNQVLDNAKLAPFLDVVINNIGDPYVGNNGIHTHDFERQILAFFCALYRSDPESTRGYVTRGGTEGNLYGIYLGRERFPDAVLYTSAASHYSIRKAAGLLRIEFCQVRANRNGEMDCADLTRQLAERRARPAIVVANIGTTVTGATDRIEHILGALREAGVERHHLHCDAALFGPMHPFIADAPPLHFELPIDSIAVSGHKFLGSPIPCGVVLTRRRLAHAVRDHVDYIGSYDSTLFGSRDGFSVLLLWRQLRRAGCDGLARWVAHCLEMSDYAMESLLAIDWPAWKNEHSNIVVLRRPIDLVCRKWHLTTEADQAHIVLMPSVERERIDRFVADLVAHRPY